MSFTSIWLPGTSLFGCEFTHHAPTFHSSPGENATGTDFCQLHFCVFAVSSSFCFPDVKRALSLKTQSHDIATVPQSIASSSPQKLPGAWLASVMSHCLLQIINISVPISVPLNSDLLRSPIKCLYRISCYSAVCRRCSINAQCREEGATVTVGGFLVVPMLLLQRTQGSPLPISFPRAGAHPHMLGCHQVLSPAVPDNNLPKSCPAPHATADICMA